MTFALLVALPDSWPPAAKTLTVLASVYAIMFAAKLNPWVKAHITGWVAVALNVALTTLGLVLAIPAAQLYTLQSFTSVVVGVLGSSGIAGMVKSVPPTAG